MQHRPPRSPHGGSFVLPGRENSFDDGPPVLLTTPPQPPKRPNRERRGSDPGSGIEKSKNEESQGGRKSPNVAATAAQIQISLHKHHPKSPILSPCLSSSMQELLPSLRTPDNHSSKRTVCSPLIGTVFREDGSKKMSIRVGDSEELERSSTPMSEKQTKRQKTLPELGSVSQKSTPNLLAGTMFHTPSRKNSITSPSRKNSITSPSRKNSITSRDREKEKEKDEGRRKRLPSLFGSSKMDTRGNSEESLLENSREDIDLPDIKLCYDEAHSIHKVKAGTLDRLVERLTHPTWVDTAYRDAFLQTYRCFTTPTEFLSLLVKRYNEAEEKNKAEKQDRERMNPVQLRVISVLKTWAEQTEDFLEDESLRRGVEEFFSKRSIRDSRSVQTLTNQISGIITKRAGKRMEERGSEIPCSSPRSELCVDDYAADELARQFTLMSVELFRKLTLMEFHHQAWTKKDKNLVAPNVIAVIESFNSVSEWVTSEIVQAVKLKDRVERLKKLIKMAYNFRAQNNFDGVMQVLGGLNRACVRRLKKTWDELSSSELALVEELEDLMHYTGSFQKYRKVLDESEAPCLPYFGLFLTDITFIEDGNPDYVHDGLINFGKQEMLSKVLSKIRFYQNTCELYRWDKNPQFYHKLTNLKKLSEEEAYKLSMKIEPRDPSEAIEMMLLKEDQLRQTIRELEIKVTQLENENDRLRSLQDSTNRPIRPPRKKSVLVPPELKKES